MNELVKVCGLSALIKEYGFTEDISDFELFYSSIYNKPKYKDLVNVVNEKILYYFQNLEIGEEATLYDYLVLSLREKDIIATFNWDPFLLQAYRRNLVAKPLPQLAFLHGNVEMGVCQADKMLGYIGTPCNKCHSVLQPVQLLYPITEKDYNTDPVIESQWKMLTMSLRYCYFLTILGYNAPKTDIEARKLMHEAWTSNKSVEIAQVEIIDIKREEELKENWREFTEDYHYGVTTDFKRSWLFQFPRQSCEALFDATMQNDPRGPTPFPLTTNLKELQSFILELKIEPLHIK